MMSMCYNNNSGVLFEQPIWLITFMTTIIYKKKVGICTETKTIER